MSPRRAALPSGAPRLGYVANARASGFVPPVVVLTGVRRRVRSDTGF